MPRAAYLASPICAAKPATNALPPMRPIAASLNPNCARISASSEKIASLDAGAVIVQDENNRWAESPEDAVRLGQAEPVGQRVGLRHGPNHFNSGGLNFSRRHARPPGPLRREDDRGAVRSSLVWSPPCALLVPDVGPGLSVPDHGDDVGNFPRTD